MARRNTSPTWHPNWFGLILFLVLVAAIAAFKQLKSLSPSLIESVSFAQNIAVIFTIAFAYKELQDKRRNDKQRKAELLIERYNAPEFVGVKARAAAAYRRNLFEANKDGKLTRKENLEIKKFLNLDFPTTCTNFEEEAQGLFSIFNVLNFFEELGHAWEDGSLEKTRIHTYFHEIVPDVYEDYRLFIDTMGDGKTTYYINLTRMVEDFKVFRDNAMTAGSFERML